MSATSHEDKEYPPSPGYGSIQSSSNDEDDDNEYDVDYENQRKRTLLQPSPVSTDKSSWESTSAYVLDDDNNNVNKPSSKHLLLAIGSGSGGVQKISSESELVALTSYNSGQNKDGTAPKSIPDRPERNNWRWLLLVLSMATCGFILFFCFHHKQKGEVPNKKYDYDIIYPDGKVPRNGQRKPFSMLSPVKDLGMYEYQRPSFSSPQVTLVGGIYGQGPAQRIDANDSNNATTSARKKNFPTNSWYQNLLMVLSDQKPGLEHRAYTIPYIVDVTGPIIGLRVHPNQARASSNVIQLNLIEQNALTIGAAYDPKSISKAKSTPSQLNYHYTIYEATPLGLTMEWNDFPMKSTISKGMPYATMVYDTIAKRNDVDGTVVLPTVASEIALAQSMVVDGTQEMVCTTMKDANAPTQVQRDIELHFAQSDFTWLVFVSEPVFMHCIVDETTGGMKLQVVDWANEPDASRKFIMRIALNKLCTSGNDPIYCHQEKMHPTALFLGQGNYDGQLRKHAHLFPGPHSSIEYDFPDADNNTAVQISVLKFDWDMKNTREIALHPVAVEDIFNGTVLATELITFALPHQFDIIQEVPPADFNIYCVNTLVGPSCLYEGSKWNLVYDVPNISFTAPRPPAPWAISAIGDSLQEDINFDIPDYYQKGIGDTYFSGKLLARLGRVLVVSNEVRSLCSDESSSEYKPACEGTLVPTDDSFTDALERLKSSVEIWINGSAAVPFVYDSAWGGVASCGCVFDNGICRNKFPDCTGFGDPGLNFGNAYYNDMHFHYGYHIYAAAVAANFDPEWGRSMWDGVLLLIRCIANPSVDDEYFPTWRHKDWYQGHSWASGIAMNFLNGRNQESSSEAIAAYEAVALYGQAMSKAWKGYSVGKGLVAKEIEETGTIMTASEVRSAQYYWHVKADTKIKIYPSEYAQHAVGILWQTMAQFQTWFGARPFLASGIQLIPITSISEARDGLAWSKQIYSDYATSCEADETCEPNGWSIPQLAILATVGHPQQAFKRALALNHTVYASAGGNGHSLTNTLWYISTRPSVEDPLPLSEEEKEESKETVAPYVPGPNEVHDCGQPDKCSEYVLDTIAGMYSCRQRMNWLIQERLYTEKQACYQIAVQENPNECGKCDPEAAASEELVPERCHACTPEQCNSHFNRCPVFAQTFVCTEGPSTGGCEQFQWDVPSAQCTSCCELTNCPREEPVVVRAKMEANCPPCEQDVCRGPMNKCPKHIGAQYLCLEGHSAAGCSPLPWAAGDGQCQKCCVVLPGCEL